MSVKPWFDKHLFNGIAYRLEVWHADRTEGGSKEGGAGGGGEAQPAADGNEAAHRQGVAAAPSGRAAGEDAVGRHRRLVARGQGQAEGVAQGERRPAEGR